MVSSNGRTGTNGVSMALSDTGGSLIWTERARQNALSKGYAGVWTAQPPAVTTAGGGFLSFFGER
jgi:hypothetical protein